MNKLTDKFKEIIAACSDFRKYSEYYCKMALILLVDLFLSYFYQFCPTGAKFGLYLAPFALIMFFVTIYYVFRIIFEAKQPLSRENINKNLIFFDLIYLFFIFVHPILWTFIKLRGHL